MAGEWPIISIDNLKAQSRNAIAMGPFGSRIRTENFVPQGVPIIRGGNLNAERFLDDDFVYLTEEKADELRSANAASLDIVITHRGTLGQVGIIPRCARYPRYVVSQSQLKLTVDQSKADPYFVFYYLRSPEGQHQLLANSSQTGVPAIASPTRALKAIQLPCPALPEQRAIAHILGTLDDKIELNRRMNETLEAMARAIFKSWFVNFLPVRAKIAARTQTGDPVRLPAKGSAQAGAKHALSKAEGAKCRPSTSSGQAIPGLPKHLADLFPDSFEDSELGEIPKGWRVGTLGDVADHPRRGVQPGEIEASTPYIALEHMPRRCIALSEWGAADGLESNKCEFKRGEILFGKLRPYFHKVGVAPVDGVCSTDIVVMTPRAEKWFGFVLGHVSSNAFVEHTSAGSTGTKMPRTSWGDMAGYAVVLPPDSIATAFTGKIHKAVARILASIHESRTLAALRDTLLPKLISCELRIKDAGRIIGRLV